MLTKADSLDGPLPGHLVISYVPLGVTTLTRTCVHGLAIIIGHKTPIHCVSGTTGWLACCESLSLQRCILYICVFTYGLHGIDDLASVLVQAGHFAG